MIKVEIQIRTFPAADWTFDDPEFGIVREGDVIVQAKAINRSGATCQAVAHHVVSAEEAKASRVDPIREARLRLAPQALDMLLRTLEVRA